MTFWILVWKCVLLIALVVFAGMTIIVTIGGAWDIRSLFHRLRDQEDSPPQ
jgi:hypothetical protein